PPPRDVATQPLQQQQRRSIPRRPGAVELVIEPDAVGAFEERHGFDASLRPAARSAQSRGQPPRGEAPQSVIEADASRRRPATSSRSFLVIDGYSLRSPLKSQLVSPSSVMSLSATTVAERGPPSSRAISPNVWPDPSRPRVRPLITTRASPSTIRKN